MKHFLFPHKPIPNDSGQSSEYITQMTFLHFAFSSQTIFLLFHVFTKTFIIQPANNQKIFDLAMSVIVQKCYTTSIVLSEQHHTVALMYRLFRHEARILKISLKTKVVRDFNERNLRGCNIHENEQCNEKEI